MFKKPKLQKSRLMFVIKGLGISLGFAAVFTITYSLNQNYLNQVVETVAVAIVKTDLLPGELLKADKLTMAEMPVYGLAKDYVTDIEELLDQGPWYGGTLGLGAGDVLRPQRLRQGHEGSRDWVEGFDLTEDMALVAVNTDLVRSGGDWLKPGMRVDALVYLPEKNSYEDYQPAQIIGPEEDPLLSNLLVVGKKNSAGIAIAAEQAGDSYNRDLIPAVVTFMVAQDDWEIIKGLICYNEEGKIYLSPHSGLSYADI